MHTVTLLGQANIPGYASKKKVHEVQLSFYKVYYQRSRVVKHNIAVSSPTYLYLLPMLFLHQFPW